MIKQKTIIEVKIGERNYELFCAADSPLGELHDALMQMKGYCVDRMVAAHEEEKNNAEQMKQQEQGNTCTPEVIVEN